jgi:hypothetical protein
MLSKKNKRELPYRKSRPGEKESNGERKRKNTKEK